MAVLELRKWLDYEVLKSIYLNRFWLGPEHLGCIREVAALHRWLLAQVLLYIRRSLLKQCANYNSDLAHLC